MGSELDSRGARRAEPDLVRSMFGGLRRSEDCVRTK